MARSFEQQGVGAEHEHERHARQPAAAREGRDARAQERRRDPAAQPAHAGRRRRAAPPKPPYVFLFQDLRPDAPVLQDTSFIPAAVGDGGARAVFRARSIEATWWSYQVLPMKRKPSINVPESLKCPITLDDYDPVSTHVGHTYELEAILKHFESAKVLRDPKSRAELKSSS